MAGCTYHLPAAQQEPHETAYLFTKNVRELSGKSHENRPLAEISQDGQSARTRQENKKGSSP